jgi:hypothetical protein
MMHEKMRRGDRGVVLIVIVGVLAVLSLLAATFGMIARLELAVSRNQTEHEMAREAAHAGAEYLLSALQSWLNGSSMTSGAVPTFLPNVADTDGILQYKRDGVKVYFAVNSIVPTGSVTPDWLQGLGLLDAGMFNLNAMGFASDLGSNLNPDIRYTSFDCSLVRLLMSRFAAITSAPINSNDMSNIQLVDANFGNVNEQQRVAILLSQALITWRYGPDGLPGTAGTEERRLGHLPRWNSKLGAQTVTGDIVGIHDAGGNAYPPASPAWGASTYNGVNTYYGNYDLASLLINWAGPGLFPMSYFEPGGGMTTPPTGEWRSYSTDATWGNDKGLPVPGLFWGKVGTGSLGNSVVADNAQPGWRDWPGSIWNNCSIYFATGPNKWRTAQIQSSSAPNTLTLIPSVPPLSVPNPGDSFCIFMQQPYNVGQLNQRWNATAGQDFEGDLVPNAMLWPDVTGTLATEGNVWDLMVDNDTLLALGGNYGGVANMGTSTQIVAPTDNSLYDSSKSAIWTLHAFQGKNYVVHIYGGTGRGQVRTIQDNTSTQLILYNPATGNPAYWTAGNTPDLTSQYRIEWPDNNLTSKFQPNNLQGDDRLYLSLGSLRDSVIVPALASDGLGNPPPLNTSSAQAVADILLPYLLPYLTVSTQAIQASQSLCSINDWAVDGVDNDANGIVDDPGVAPTGEAQHEQSSPQQGNAGRAALALSLYNGLGLSTWAHIGAAAGSTTTTATRVQQAAQLVANIIDFRDPTDVPTVIAKSAARNDLNETAAAIPNFTVYGAKGLHVTQVMPSPDPIYSALSGAEMTNNGSPTGDPLHDWAWNPAGYWYVQDTLDPGNPNPPGTPTAIFKFGNLMPGYYAMRLIGSPSAFTLSYGGVSYTVTPSIVEPENAALSTAFVRKPADHRLVCFQVPSSGPNAGTLTFQLQPPLVNAQSAQFWGFALCAQYIQLTNIATHDILLNNLTVTTDQGPLLGGTGQPWLPNYTRADGGYVDLQRIPGAAVGALGFISDSASGSPPVPTSSTATFPIDYGTYVICMSEESYEKQWSAQNGDPDYSTTPSSYNPGGLIPPPMTNGDGIWGDAPNEAYPIYPFGDLNNDTQTMFLLMGVRKGPPPVILPTDYTPSVIVTDLANDLIAGGPATDGSYVDGKIPQMNTTQLDSTYHNVLSCYSSIEKTVILQPTWDTTAQYGPYWAPYQGAQAIPPSPAPVALAASQNTLVIGQDDPPRVPSGSTFRSCLNKSYTAIWDPAAITNLSWSAAAIWPATVPPTIMWNTAKRWATLAKPSLLASQARVFPFILNRPYPTTGWLGLVPTSNTDAANNATAALAGTPAALGSWRTIDPNPTPSVIINGTVQPNPPTCPEQLLGTVMSNATVGGVYARFNINTAPVDTLKAVFPDADAALIVAERQLRQQSQPAQQPPWWGATGAAWVAGTPTALGTAGASPPLSNQAWANWDELLNDPIFQYSRNCAPFFTPTAAWPATAIGFYDELPLPGESGISNADAGAGTYADGFPDSSNEKKEWFMRFSNLFCLQSTSFQFTVAGLVYADRPWDPVTMQNNEPVAMVRIEVDVDLSTGTPSIVHFRYLTQQ